MTYRAHIYSIRLTQKRKKKTTMVNTQFLVMRSHGEVAIEYAQIKIARLDVSANLSDPTVCHA